MHAVTLGFFVGVLGFELRSVSSKHSFLPTEPSPQLHQVATNVVFFFFPDKSFSWVTLFIQMTQPVSGLGCKPSLSLLHSFIPRPPGLSHQTGLMKLYTDVF